MAIENTISIPYTITGGISSGNNAGVNTLSGFTGKLSVFKFQIDPSSNQFNFAPHLSNDKFVWDLGDGTRIKGVSANHFYTFPGVYTTSLVAYNSAGLEYLSTVTKEVSVGNFFDNTLTIDNNDIVNVHNVIAGDKTNRINIKRQNSWQPHNALSANGYTVNLYASGSNSKKLNFNDFNNFKWNHLSKTWSFFTPSTSNNNTILFSPTDSVDTSYEEVYIRETIIDSAQTFVRVTSSFLASPSGNQAVFVGTSGSGEVVYSDSSPKLTKQPVFVYGYIDFSNYPDHKYIYGDFPSIDTPLKYFEQYSLVIPVRVKYNTAQNIEFTSSSIKSMPLSKIKYKLTEIPFFVNLTDNNGNIIQNYQQLNINPNTGGIANSQSSFVVNLSCVKSTDSTFTSVSLLSTHYYKENEPNIPTNIDSTFKGHFIPAETSDNAKIQGSVIVDNVANFPKDINFAYLTNKDLGKTIRVFFRDNYQVNKTTGSIENNLTVNITPLTSIGGDVFDMTDSSNPISVTFDSDDINNSRVTAYFASTSSSSLTAFDSYITTKKIFEYSDVYVTPDLFNTRNIANVYYFDSIGPNGNNYSSPDALIDPTYVSIDESRNALLACPEVSFVQYVSSNYSTFPIVDLITNINNNRTYTTVSSGQSRLSVSNGIDIVELTDGNKNLIQPSLVDAGLYNTVWVCNTNPFSATLVQYSKSSDQNILPDPVYTYEFNQPLSPKDICVDNRNNCWVAVENKHRHLRGYVNEGDTNDYDRSLSARTAGALGSLGITGVANKSNDNFTYILNTVSFAISSNELFEVDGFQGGSANSKYFNGTFLVTSVSANPNKTEVVVNPYPGVYNQAPSTTGSVSPVSAFKRPSDRVYKFDSNSSKLFTVSGFLNPEHIVVDGNQNLWVSHNTDTITQINTAGSILGSYNVRNDSFVSNYVSAGADLVKAHRGTVTSINTLSTVQHHIGGISLDTYENVLVINSFENKLYTIPINNVSLSASYSIGCDMSPASAVHGFTYGKLEAKGDWTGFRWLNKYKNTFGNKTVTGDATFGVYSSDGQYVIRKVNENYDPAETFKSYRSVDFLLDQNVLFDDFISSIIGTVSGESDELGRVVYEKISNFVDNVSDPETCNIKSLYSLFKQFNLNINNYNLNYPGKLKRIVDLLSIPHYKLWGQLEKFDRDINLAVPGSIELPNIGNELTFNTYVVSADQPIIARHMYTNSYQKINTHGIAAFSDTGWGSTSSPHYVSKFNIVSAYPLSAFSPYWGWGLDNGLSGSDISKNIKFFEYKNVYSDLLVEGMIDWNNPQTTLSRSNSGINDWNKDYGIVESLIDVELRKGLDLFNVSLSSYSPGVL